MDEVGANTSQKGAGAVGGEKFVYEKGTTPKEKCSTKSKHWTLLGFTVLDETSVICLLIFTGNDEVPLHATCMYVFAEVEGVPNDIDFLGKNCGPGKIYHGGPKCMFK